MMGGRQVFGSFKKQRSDNLSDRESETGLLKIVQNTTRKTKTTLGGRAPTAKLRRGPERPRFGGACSAQTCVRQSSGELGRSGPRLDSPTGHLPGKKGTNQFLTFQNKSNANENGSKRNLTEN
jgi:hypothetical protein